MEGYGLFVNFFGMLILVAALAYLAIRYGLRIFSPGINRGKVKVLERVPLDAKGGSALLLVQLGEELLLVGAAQGGVSLLKELSPDALKCMEKAPSLPAGRLSALPSFGRILENMRVQLAEKTLKRGPGNK